MNLKNKILIITVEYVLKFKYDHFQKNLFVRFGFVFHVHWKTYDLGQFEFE